MEQNFLRFTGDRLGEKSHREGDELPPLSLFAPIAMTIGSPIVTIASGWQPSQLKKTATAPEGKYAQLLTAPW